MIAWDGGAALQRRGDSPNRLHRAAGKTAKQSSSAPMLDGVHQIFLLMESHGNFGRSMRSRKSASVVLVDGPHGTSPHIEQYDRVLLVAIGTGIAAHLLAVRHLLEAHEQMTGRVRRVSLAWYTNQQGRPTHLDYSRLTNCL